MNAPVLWRSLGAQGVLEISMRLRTSPQGAPLKVLLQGKPAAPSFAQAVQSLLHWQAFCAGLQLAPPGQQVICDFSAAPDNQGWQLAAWLALLALRMPECGLPAQGAACASLESNSELPPAPAGWQGALPLLQASPSLPPVALRVARCHFPVIGAAPELAWVEAAQIALPAALEEDDVQACGLAPDLAHALCDCILATRASDTVSALRWRSLLRFGGSAAAARSGSLSGNSWQLAAVLADRISRGRELPNPAGRIIASGAAQAWPQVQSVAGCAAKCALLTEQAQSGDRIVLPHAWRTELAADFIDAMQARQCQLKLVQQLGFWPA